MINLSPKRLAILTGSALGTVAAFLLLYHFHSVVLLFVASVALAAVIRPFTVRLTRLGLSRSLAVLALVLLVFVSFFAFIGVSAYVLTDQLPRAATDLQFRYGELRGTLASGAGWQQSIANRLPPPESLEGIIADLELGATQPSQTPPNAVEATPVSVTPESAPTGALPVGNGAGPAAAVPPANANSPATSQADESVRRASALLRVLAGATTSVVGLLAQFVVLVFLSLYWSLEFEWFERLWTSLLPASRRAGARDTWRAVEENVGGHLRSELVQTAAAFVLLWLGFGLVGAPYPLLLAWVCALAWLIPLVGWLAALLPVALIGLASGPGVALFALIWQTIVFAVLEFIVEPRMDVRRRAGSILGLLVAMTMLEAFGLVGLIVAGPLAVAINTLLVSIFAIRAAEQVRDRSAFGGVQARLAELRAAMENAPEELPLRTRSLYERLDELVLRVEREA